MVEGTGQVALEITLGSVRRNTDGSLAVSAGTSTGPIDHALYECTLVRQGDAWQVEACVATIMT